MFRFYARQQMQIVCFPNNIPIAYEAFLSSQDIVHKLIAIMVLSYVEFPMPSIKTGQTICRVFCSSTEKKQMLDSCHYLLINLKGRQNM